MPKKKSLNTISRDIKDNDRDRITVEIGDSKNPSFKPQFKVSRWQNAANFSLRAEEKPEGIISQEGNTVLYATSEYVVRMYDDLSAGEDGGFEFDWVLPAKPSTNVLRGTVQTKGLDIYYQDTLTPEEIAFGAIRPDNVIGSYAAYYNRHFNGSQRQEFRTGKAFHIYRPKAVDALNNEVWCDLLISGEQLTVTVPQAFLDSATYPVTVDPTFGYTSIGASSFSASADTGVALRGTAPEDGTVDSITIYFSSDDTGRNFKGILYSDGTSPTQITNGVGNIVAGTAAAEWLTSTFSTPPSISNATVYYLGIVDDSGFINYHYDTTGGPASNQMKYGALTYSSPEATWSSPSNFGWFLSAYATYTAASTPNTSNFFF